jgi:hypothetical protein
VRVAVDKTGVIQAPGQCHTCRAATSRGRSRSAPIHAISSPAMPSAPSRMTP